MLLLNGFRISLFLYFQHNIITNKQYILTKEYSRCSNHQRNVQSDCAKNTKSLYSYRNNRTINLIHNNNKKIATNEDDDDDDGLCCCWVRMTMMTTMTMTTIDYAAAEWRWWWRCWWWLHDTVQCRYNAVDFLQIHHKRHPIARPLGRGMGCLLLIGIYIQILPQSLQWCVQYHVILDRVITALDCNIMIPQW